MLTHFCTIVVHSTLKRESYDDAIRASPDHFTYEKLTAVAKVRSSELEVGTPTLGVRGSKVLSYLLLLRLRPRFSAPRTLSRSCPGISCLYTADWCACCGPVCFLHASLSLEACRVCAFSLRLGVQRALPPIHRRRAKEWGKAAVFDRYCFCTFVPAHTSVLCSQNLILATAQQDTASFAIYCPMF